MTSHANNGDELIGACVYHEAKAPTIRDATRAWSYPAAESHPGVAGFQLLIDRVLPVKSGTGHATSLVVPLWALVLIFGVLPTWRAIRWLHRRRLCPGFCRACGYDLRATPDRCPECGATASPA